MAPPSQFRGAQNWGRGEVTRRGKPRSDTLYLTRFALRFPAPAPGRRVSENHRKPPNPFKKAQINIPGPKIIKRMCTKRWGILENIGSAARPAGQVHS